MTPSSTDLNWIDLCGWQMTENDCKIDSLYEYDAWASEESL